MITSKNYLNESIILILIETKLIEDRVKFRFSKRFFSSYLKLHNKTKKKKNVDIVFKQICVIKTQKIVRKVDFTQKL